jgi:hypothetical protein
MLKRELAAEIRRQRKLIAELKSECDNYRERLELMTVRHQRVLDSTVAVVEMLTEDNETLRRMVQEMRG